MSDEAPQRFCSGPHGWCGDVASVVAQTGDGRWYACKRQEHQGSRNVSMQDFWRYVQGLCFGPQIPDPFDSPEAVANSST
jgi:hypothetical protein